MKLAHDRLVIDEEPKNILFVSEPYVVHMRTGFTVAANVVISKSGLKADKTLLLSAQSLSDGLLPRMMENGGMLSGVEVWIYKSGPERTSKYIIED